MSNDFKAATSAIRTNADADAPRAPAKRPWRTPAIVGTLQAFEHAILACNGRPSGSLVCSATKGACLVVCTANS